jgi:hypothetical protein
MRREYIIKLIEAVGIKRPIAEQIVERLQAEDLLNLNYGDAEISKICEAFKRVFGTTKTTRYDRYAAARLADKYTADIIVQLIEALAAKSNEPYAPTVGSVSQLEEKLVSVISFLRKNNIVEIEL